MGWFEKQDTPLGRVGFIGYTGRYLLRIALIVFIGGAVITAFRLAMQAV